jgi:hypothetical protein
MTYKKGFRMMTMGWTDGSTFVPIASSLLSSKNDQNVIGTTKKIDKRTIASKRRIMAQSKGTDVVIQLLDQALKAGLTAKYVMFDTWFSNPHQIVQISQRGLNVIAMVKKSSKITYEFEGKRMNVKQIFNACKKRRGRSRYLLSVPVKVGDPAKDGAQIDARIVCVRNRSNRKDWIALICTDMTIDENEIIRIYGKRWDIEVFFKTCKSFLKLGTEYHGLSYDALTAHTAFVFLRYMFMSVEKRDDEDDRTMGELFYCMIDELADITFHHSLQILVEAMFESVKEIFQPTEEQMERFTKAFISRLPKYMQEALSVPAYRGDKNLVLLSVKELQPQLILQLLHHLRYRPLRDKLTLRRLLKAALFNYLAEHLQLFKIHRLTFSKICPNYLLRLCNRLLSITLTLNPL